MNPLRLASAAALLCAAASAARCRSAQSVEKCELNAKCVAVLQDGALQRCKKVKCHNVTKKNKCSAKERCVWRNESCKPFRRMDVEPSECLCDGVGNEYGFGDKCVYDDTVFGMVAGCTVGMGCEAENTVVRDGVKWMNWPIFEDCWQNWRKPFVPEEFPLVNGSESVPIPYYPALDYSGGFEHEQGFRSWLQREPAGFRSAPVRSVPLIIDFHGYAWSALSLSEMTNFDKIGAREGALVVWPDAVQLKEPGLYGGSWNAGVCCSEAAINGYDDVGFVNEMIDRLFEQYPMIDQTRVYLTGHSNGCSFAQRVAAELTDRIAAVSCFAMYNVMEEKPASYGSEGKGFVPVLLLHGVEDVVVPIQYDTEGAPPHLITYFLNQDLSRTLRKWADWNECIPEMRQEVGLYESGIPREGLDYADGSTLIFYDHCSAGTFVGGVVVPGVGHSPYQSVKNQPFSEIAWDFMKRYTNRRE